VIHVRAFAPALEHGRESSHKEQDRAYRQHLHQHAAPREEEMSGGFHLYTPL